MENIPGFSTVHSCCIVHLGWKYIKLIQIHTSKSHQSTCSECLSVSSANACHGNRHFLIIIASGAIRNSVCKMFVIFHVPELAKCNLIQLFNGNCFACNLSIEQTDEIIRNTRRSNELFSRRLIKNLKSPVKLPSEMLVVHRRSYTINDGRSIWLNTLAHLSACKECVSMAKCNQHTLGKSFSNNWRLKKFLHIQNGETWFMQEYSKRALNYDRWQFGGSHAAIAQTRRRIWPNPHNVSQAGFWSCISMSVRYGKVPQRIQSLSSARALLIYSRCQWGFVLHALSSNTQKKSI